MKRALWTATAGTLARDEVRCCTLAQACQHFASQPWAQHVNEIQIRCGSERFTLRRSKVRHGWVMPV